MVKRKKVKIITEGWLNLETGELTFHPLQDGDRVETEVKHGKIQTN